MFRSIALAMTVLFVALGLASCASGSGASLDAKSHQALNSLLAQNNGARRIDDTALAVLVFPSITKGGFMVAGHHGNGTLIKDGADNTHYKSVSVSYGPQAGIQKFGYALFFMNERALSYVNKTDGWDLGVGPSLVVVDAGFARRMTTTSARSDVYAFVFDQKGLMAGLGLKGTKITRIARD